ncbi:hypothetical protein Taro_044040 [Colocasia esculenta]|uniref:Uncharacterized protein n=1 Tax=Colocasia esculenta TaxID=4460 RepID=A0A843X1X0_COLES|nr:hypothetical protein [Colocasia esculenta]
MSFLSRRVCAEGCFRIVSDFARSAEVVSCPTLVVGRGVTLFRCFVVLCCRSVSGGATFGVPGGDPGGRVVTVVSEPQGSNEICNELITMVASFPAGSERLLQESVSAVAGHACYKCGHPVHSRFGWVRRQPACPCGCVAKAERSYAWCGLHRCRIVLNVWSRVPVRRCALWSSQSASLLELSRCFVCRVAPLVERCDTCLWLLSALCWLVVSSGEVLPEFFSVGSGGSEKRPVACLLPLLSMGYSEWWCSAMAFGAVFCTVATFVVKRGLLRAQSHGFRLAALVVFRLVWSALRLGSCRHPIVCSASVGVRSVSCWMSG